MKMRFFVVPEQLRGGDALDLGAKMRKEVRMAQQHRQDAEAPAEDMRAAEALGFSLRNGGEDLTRRGGEEFLLLNEPDAGVQWEKIRRHDEKRCKQGDLHFC